MLHYELSRTTELYRSSDKDISTAKGPKPTICNDLFKCSLTTPAVWAVAVVLHTRGNEMAPESDQENRGRKGLSVLSA